MKLSTVNDEENADWIRQLREQRNQTESHARHHKDPFDSSDAPFPELADHAEDLARRVGNIIEREGEDLIDTVQARLEDSELSDLRRQAKQAKQDPSQAVPADQVVEQFQISDLLTDVVTTANRDAMRAGAEHHARRLAEELEDEVGEEAAEVALGFDIEDTAALEEMENTAAARMTSVEQTVKENVRDAILRTMDEEGATVDAITSALRDEITELSNSHARLVARTETMTSSRHGSQALAESNDAVGGKEWIATRDNRTRPWHAEMHGTIVPVDQSFTVPAVGDPKQPSDYPRQAKVVGDDQPYHCRCDQAPVLRDDLPTDLRSLTMLEGVTVKGVEPDLHTAPSSRAREAMREHALPTETFSEFVQRVDSEPWSRNETSDRLGIAKQTWYNWLDEAQDVTA